MTLQLVQPDWPAPDNIVAYCSSRHGGYSQGTYASLNVGLHVGDNIKIVLANRAKLPNHANIAWLNQVHGNRCVAAETIHLNTSADASYSSQPQVACAVMTADCLPILLCDENGKFVAAVHAGWRGLAEGVLENTLRRHQGSNGQLLAWLGPAISQSKFEVGVEVKDAFKAYAKAFIPSSNRKKYFADLYQIARAKLRASGIEEIYGGEFCTYQDEARFFSHRRATHQGMNQTGRMVSVIYRSR